MDWVFFLMAALAALMVFGLIIHLVSIFSSEGDNNDGFFGKLIIVVSFTLVSYNLLMLPYSVAALQYAALIPESKSNVLLLWTIVAVALVIFGLVICPFVLVYHEVGNHNNSNAWKRVCVSVAMTLLVVVLASSAFYCGWHFAGYANVGYTAYSTSIQPVTSFESIKEFSDQSQGESLRLQVSLFVYLIALLCAAGWIPLCTFGGIGLVAVPQEFLLYFRDRPRPITASEYAYRREEVARESQRLIDKGRMIEETSAEHSYGGHARKVLAFRQAVRELEAYHTTLEISYHQQGGKVLQGYLCLLAGLVFTFLSIRWILYITLSNVSDTHPMYGGMLRQLSDTSLTLCVTVYSCFAFYLLCCTIKGCIKLGGNLALYHIYPVEVNKTLTTSFLFNAILCIITSSAVLNLCADSFPVYAVNSDVSVLFSVFVANLAVVKYVVSYTPYFLVVVSCLALMWLIVSPRRYARVSRW
ncbi:hypothetical protein, conserved [Trypanosoma brucei gambiense DAL972]|uniref:LMBR1-like conserved region-containing protein n=1 Tax=Trypanosoma brucei gambiense (strain MHOM/CI/86/DAL972) TaxID=679716 RepID=D0A2E9_TRYB9|nr:hypothetical protein, conserved [Trypanosoma brucei gambiense DAL972]CBH15443.1 hypothetical protein, conserved [Trypanosoma brucei gambiense DAL972]|eukprot:XP_011777707.1 hypothetical protein, conserved [Trypanosoma brucei gambiense DAL972]